MWEIAIPVISVLITIIFAIISILTAMFSILIRELRQYKNISNKWKELHSNELNKVIQRLDNIDKKR